MVPAAATTMGARMTRRQAAPRAFLGASAVSGPAIAVATTPTAFLPRPRAPFFSSSTFSACAPARMKAPAATASARNVCVVSFFSPVAHPTQHPPQSPALAQLRGISPRCSPSASRPAPRQALWLECGATPVDTPPRPHTAARARSYRGPENSGRPCFVAHSSRTWSGVGNEAHQLMRVPPPTVAPARTLTDRSLVENRVPRSYMFVKPCASVRGRSAAGV